MAPPQSNKRSASDGMGIVTSLLQSSHNHAKSMGLGKIFGRSSSAGSSSSLTSPRSRGLDPLQLGPGSLKVDYAFGLNQTTSPTTAGPPRGYHNPAADDAPPAYSPQEDHRFNDFGADSKTHKPDKTQAGMPHSSNPLASGSVGEDEYAILKNRDIIVILDDSHSMTLVDNVGGRTRWEQAWDAVTKLVERGARYDTDGIKIKFLNRRTSDTTVKTVQDLEKLPRQLPEVGTYTPTGQVLDDLLAAYKRKTGNSPNPLRPKKLMILVVTDGAATDDPKDPIVDAAKFFQRNGFPLDQVGIQFIQVGNDQQARAWLEELDTGLKEDMDDNGRDIVDTIMSNGHDLEGRALLKALTGAVNRKQDREGETK